MFIRRLSALLLPLLSLLFPSPALAQSAWSGVCVQGDVATIQGLECLFSNILQVVFTISGFVFFLMFLRGAFIYLFSGNDPKATAQAGAAITNAVIGVLGVIFSWLILKFISDFTGLPSILDFKIPV